MKKTKKYHVIAVICIIGITIYIASMICGFIIVANEELRFLEDKEYGSIKELHCDYIKAYCNKFGDDSGIHEYPRDFVFCVNIEDKWFVFCTESDYSDGAYGEIDSHELWIYLVTERNGKYIFGTEENKSISGRLKLKDDYFDGYGLSVDYDSMKDFNSKNETIFFAYKNKENPKKFYFDGNKMQEIKAINPVTNEEFILCYGISDRTQSGVDVIINVFRRMFSDYTFYKFEALDE